MMAPHGKPLTDPQLIKTMAALSNAQPNNDHKVFSSFCLPDIFDFIGVSIELLEEVQPFQ